MSECYPYRLSVITKSPIWGGTRLLSEYGITSSAPTVGEAWMLTVRERENSVILNGSLAGTELGAVVGRENFPLLVKLIDAHDRLSVQVHPDDEYAARVENDRGKTEMWYIVEAEPDAEIIYGLAPGTNHAAFAAAVREGRYEDVMRHQPVKAGETYFIPSGMLHAIGKGILIAEIQQNCDLTYRVYDYDRIGADGAPRALHVEKAIDVTRPFTEQEIAQIRYADGDTSALADCRYFRVCKLDGAGEIRVPETGFLSLLVLSGDGELIAGNFSTPIHRGDSYYLPAGLGACTVSGNTVCLTASAKTHERKATL